MRRTVKRYFKEIRWKGLDWICLSSLRGRGASRQTDRQAVANRGLGPAVFINSEGRRHWPIALVLLLSRHFVQIPRQSTFGLRGSLVQCPGQDCGHYICGPVVSVFDRHRSLQCRGLHIPSSHVGRCYKVRLICYSLTVLTGCIASSNTQDDAD